MTVTIDPPPAVQKQPARLFARLLPVVISLAGVGFMAAAFASDATSDATSGAASADGSAGGGGLWAGGVINRNSHSNYPTDAPNRPLCAATGPRTRAP